jgi:heme exporter protein A
LSFEIPKKQLFWYNPSIITHNSKLTLFMSQKMPLLSVQHLSCRYGLRQLFTDLSFDVQAGQLSLITGHNGAGKSSLLKMLTGMKRPDQGSIYWNHQDITDPSSEYYQDMLWLGHHNPFNPDISAEDNLALLHALRPTDQISIAEAFTRVGLPQQQRHKKVRHYSAGMQRRLALASLLLSPARLWILDEPQTALDVQGIILCETLLTEFVQQGGSIIMTSHHPLHLPSVNIQQLTLGR